MHTPNFTTHTHHTGVNTQRPLLSLTQGQRPRGYLTPKLGSMPATHTQELNSALTSRLLVHTLHQIQSLHPNQKMTREPTTTTGTAGTWNENAAGKMAQGQTKQTGARSESHSRPPQWIRVATLLAPIPVTTRGRPTAQLPGSRTPHRTRNRQG